MLYTNEEIGKKLFITESTIKTHINDAHGRLIPEAGTPKGPTAIIEAIKRGELNTRELIKGFYMKKFRTLSNAEKRVLKELANEEATDHSNETLQKRLNISEGTVKIHLINIRQKMGARNSKHAAALYASAKRELPDEDRPLLEPLSDRTRSVLKVLTQSSNIETFIQKLQRRSQNPRQEITNLYKALGAKSLTEVLIKAVEFGHIDLDRVKKVDADDVSKLTDQEKSLIELLVTNRGKHTPDEIEHKLGIAHNDVDTMLGVIKEKFTGDKKILYYANPILRYMAMVAPRRE